MPIGQIALGKRARVRAAHRSHRVVLATMIVLGGCASRGAGSAQPAKPACHVAALPKVDSDLSCIVELRLRERSAAPIEVMVVVDGDVEALRSTGFPLPALPSGAHQIQAGLTAAQIRALIEFEQVLVVRLPGPPPGIQ